MNILIVDDLPEVVEGILAGVSWEALKIEQRFKAYNIFDAQDIINNNSIQLMLCDIEMPLGSGLELLEWISNNHYDIKCIFLTAHSDFCYAQRAVRLQGFDYLLQPVTYKQIEEALRRAIDQIKVDGITKNYYDYGKQLKKYEKDTLVSIIRDYVLGFNNNTREVLKYMSILSMPMEATTECGTLLLQILDWTAQPWPSDQLLFSMNNVLSELLERYIQKLILVGIDSDNYYLIYINENKVDMDIIRQIFIEFISICNKYFNCKIACYENPATIFVHLHESLSELIKTSEYNVIKESKLFLQGELSEDRTGYIAPDLSKWANLLKHEYYDMARAEIYKYLDAQIKLGNMNMSVLKRFHQDFIYLFFGCVQKNEFNTQDIFSMSEDSDYDYNTLMNSFTSVERIKSLVDFAIKYLKRQDNNEDIGKSRIEDIMEYINKNIHKEISRRDVANAVYLNPEYLSRLFQKEKGVTLSEYILDQKMNIAKQLLQSTHFSVTIVASKVGYTNFSHFTKSFKKVFDISPSEYRKQINHGHH